MKASLKESMLILWAEQKVMEENLEDVNIN